jgi:serine/threonine protein kinase
LGALPPMDVVTIIHQVCKALSRAHARGIVHRDIKPENIYLVDSDGELFVKILDFGVAKRNETPLRATFSGVTVGTPFYMSPEQVLSSKDVDFHTDLWSVAVVAYHALTARVPFHADTVGAICVAIDKAVFAPPSSVRPQLNPAIDSWFDKAFARDAAARFESAKEMAMAFELAVLGTFEHLVAPAIMYDTVPPPSPLPPAVVHDTPLEATITKPTPRGGKFWLLAAGVAMTLVGAGAAALAVVVRSPPPVRTPATALVYVTPTATTSSSAAQGDALPAGVMVEPTLQVIERASPPAAPPTPAVTSPPARRAPIRHSSRGSSIRPPPASVPRSTSAPAPTQTLRKDRGF